MFECVMVAGQAFVLVGTHLLGGVMIQNDKIDRVMFPLAEVQISVYDENPHDAGVIYGDIKQDGETVSIMLEEINPVTANPNDPSQWHQFNLKTFLENCK